MPLFTRPVPERNRSVGHSCKTLTRHQLRQLPTPKATGRDVGQEVAAKKAVPHLCSFGC